MRAASGDLAATQEFLAYVWPTLTRVAAGVLGARASRRGTGLGVPWRRRDFGEVVGHQGDGLTCGEAPAHWVSARFMIFPMSLRGNASR